MQITNELSLPVPPEEAWPVLLDLEKIAPCLPGASITGVDGNSYEGKAKIKVGPITAEYRGSAELVEQDENAGRAVIRATGRDARGQGNASATITAQLVADGPGSRLLVQTDLDITGKVAQFGRGVINDAASALLTTFAERLGNLLTVQSPQEPDRVEDGKPATSASVLAAPASAARPDEPLDLLRVAKDARANRAERGPTEIAATTSMIAASVACFAAGLAIGAHVRGRGL